MNDHGTIHFQSVEDERDQLRIALEGIRNYANTMRQLHLSSRIEFNNAFALLNTPKVGPDIASLQSELSTAQHDKHWADAQHATELAEMRKAIIETCRITRKLEAALMSQFPGEDGAIAQLQQGHSWIEKSIINRKGLIKSFDLDPEELKKEPT